MSLMIKEYTDPDFCHPVREYDTGGLQITEADKYTDAIDPNSLMVEIEGIHALPFATRNFTRYTPKCLKNSTASWVSPYRRPLIRHHNEQNGEIIGRIINAEYKTRGTLSGTPALLFTVNVPGAQTKEDVRNGIHSTTSIGVIAHDVRCSICGKQLASGDMCEHERGSAYETPSGQQTCYWDIHDMEAKELSYVIVPSDMYSKNIAVYPAAGTRDSMDTQIKESFTEINTPDKGATEMPDTNELTEARAHISELETRIKEISAGAEIFKSQLAEAKEANVNLETRLAEITKANQLLEANAAGSEHLKQELEKKISELTLAGKNLEARLADEAAMRETLESELSKARTAMKKSLIETVSTMRRSLGYHEISPETAMERSEDSLRDSIADLKEALEKKASAENEDGKNAVPGAGSVADPTLPSPDNHEVKESRKASEKIDLRCGLQNIFSSVLSAHY